MSRTQIVTLANAVTQAGAASNISQTASVFREVFREATILLNVTSASTLVGDTLDVFIDSSPDAGITWFNVGHFTQVLGNGGAVKHIMSLRADNPGATAVVSVTADAVAGATRQFGINDRLRPRHTTVGTGSFTYSVVAFLK